MIQQEDIAAIFRKADKTNTGTLDLKDFKEVVGHICERYPQVELYLQKNKLKSFDALLKNAQGDDKKQIDIEIFKKALSEVDSQMKSLPPTAQVKHILVFTFLLTLFNHL
jgi:NADH:ubiquinone reductase (non-electrogenic)